MQEFQLFSNGPTAPGPPLARKRNFGALGGILAI
jgi:hypothetical protein